MRLHWQHILAYFILGLEWRDQFGVEPIVARAKGDSETAECLLKVLSSGFEHIVRHSIAQIEGSGHLVGPAYRGANEESSPAAGSQEVAKAHTQLQTALSLPRPIQGTGNDYPLKNRNGVEPTRHRLQGEFESHHLTGNTVPVANRRLILGFSRQASSRTRTRYS